ncbi:hypothetical protein RUMOBE_00461 [Blautia obeum ATCC 29174]|uniref:Uncharacterized protein n=1 Tax=Blautia obeum ATCC 29174 TaxID=411459 RepID=A5ZN95_9FIRM|nr:hypothetical protein RUMOBE_00461 [Blautia obeum ATCC 29174]
MVEISSVFSFQKGPGFPESEACTINHQVYLML